MSLDVVIPALNEETTVKDIVRRFLVSPNVCRVIVVIDKGTSDMTSVNAYQKIGDKESEVIDLGWKSPHGKGQCVTLGMSQSCGYHKRIVFCDADLRGFSTTHAEMLASYESGGMLVGVPEVPDYVNDTVRKAWPWVAGERNVPFHEIHNIEFHGYGMETQLNYHMALAGYTTHFAPLEGCIANYSMSPQRIQDRERDRFWLKQNGYL